MADEVRYVAEYAAMLMDRNEMQEAQLWLDRLQELAPENSSTITLQAEALVRQKQPDLAVRSFHKFLDRPTEKVSEHDAQILRAVSILKTLVTGAGSRGDKASHTALLKETATLVRDYLTRAPGRHILATFTLLQEGLVDKARVDKALDVAEESWPKADVNARSPSRRP